MDETRTAPHSAATRPEEAFPDDAFELVGAGWREHRPALRRPGWRQRLARLPLYYGLARSDLDAVVEQTYGFFEGR